MRHVVVSILALMFTTRPIPSRCSYRRASQVNKKKLGGWMRLWIVGSLLWAPFALASDRILPRDSTIYIEKTNFDFHVYLKAAIIKKKLPLKIVRKKENADFHLLGTTQRARGKRFTAALEIWNRQDVLVWATEAGGGSLYDRAVGGLGLRKAASNLANKLKKVIQTKKARHSRGVIDQGQP